MGFVTAFSYVYMLTCLVYIVPCPLASFLVLTSPTSTLITCSCGPVNFTRAAYRRVGYTTKGNASPSPLTVNCIAILMEEQGLHEPLPTPWQEVARFWDCVPPCKVQVWKLDSSDSACG